MPWRKRASCVALNGLNSLKSMTFNIQEGRNRYIIPGMTTGILLTDYSSVYSHKYWISIQKIWNVSSKSHSPDMREMGRCGGFTA